MKFPITNKHRKEIRNMNNNDKLRHGRKGVVSECLVSYETRRDKAREETKCDGWVGIDGHARRVTRD
jgi:hypothetical protein